MACGDATLTYAELDGRANRLAPAADRGAGSGPESLVAVVPASGRADLVVAVLAVLKAGGAYLPLDPDYPAERLAFMLSRPAARLAVTVARRRRAGRAGLTGAARWSWTTGGRRAGGRRRRVPTPTPGRCRPSTWPT